MSILTPIEIETIRSGNYLEASSSLLACVSCGYHRITCPIVEFYAFNGAKLLCYECQRKFRSSSSFVSVKEVLINS